MQLTIKERRTIQTAIMKIQYSHSIRKIHRIFCPHCRSTHFHKHGSYTRYWFHVMPWGADQTRKVQRYLCCNKCCPHKTFTVQPPDALPYCRFLLNDLLAVDTVLRAGKSVHFISRTLHLSRSVIRRARRFVRRTRCFLQTLCREIDVYDCTPVELFELFQTV
jgi:transposase-like protein